MVPGVGTSCNQYWLWKRIIGTYNWHNSLLFYSLNKIRYNLIKKGIDEKYIKASISKIKENESDPDFFSAIKICKRRRIGPCREESNRPLFYKKDISILARSGFSYEISKKVLEIPKEEFKKFCMMI